MNRQHLKMKRNKQKMSSEDEKPKMENIEELRWDKQTLLFIESSKIVQRGVNGEDEWTTKTSKRPKI